MTESEIMVFQQIGEKLWEIMERNLIDTHRLQISDKNNKNKYNSGDKRRKMDCAVVDFTFSGSLAAMSP